MSEINRTTNLRIFLNASQEGDVIVAEQAFTSLVTAQTGTCLKQQISGAFFEVVEGLTGGNAKHMSCHTQECLLMTIGQKSSTARIAAQRVTAKLTA